MHLEVINFGFFYCSNNLVISLNFIYGLLIFLPPFQSSRRRSGRCERERGRGGGWRVARALSPLIAGFSSLARLTCWRPPLRTPNGSHLLLPGQLLHFPSVVDPAGRSIRERPSAVGSISRRFSHWEFPGCLIDFLASWFCRNRSLNRRKSGGIAPF